MIKASIRKPGAAPAQNQSQQNTTEADTSPFGLKDSVRRPTRSTFPLDSESSIEVFDFRAHWRMIEPYLNDPQVQAALRRGMNQYIEVINAKFKESWFDIKEYNPEVGPWQYDPHLWENHVQRLPGRTIGEDEGVPWHRLPQPGTFQWYQLHEGCNYLAEWLQELGKRAFHGLDWKRMTGAFHSFAYGTDKIGNIRMIFDILHFDSHSATELIEMTALCCPCCGANK